MHEGDACHDGGQCAATFKLGSQTFYESCGRIRPDVLGRLFAVGSSGFRYDQARMIRGVEPGFLVAVRGQSSDCLTGEELGRRWMMASAGTPSWDLSANGALKEQRIFCRIAVSPEPSCARGGEAEWLQNPSIADRMREVTRFEYFPEYVRRVNDRARTDPALEWKLAPLDVVSRWRSDRDEDWCQGGDREEQFAWCREGFVVRTQEEGRVVLEVWMQHVYEGSEPIEAWSLILELEKLDQGPGWWVVAERHGFQKSLDRWHADDLWRNCCDRLIFDNAPEAG